MSKHPWWWLLRFDPCPSILDDYYWDFIHVQASLMNIEIWSMAKHSWWWLLQFNPCPSILDDVDWDFINVQAYLMMMGVWSMYKYPCWWSSGFNPCLKTNFLSSWPIFCHRDQIFVTMTKNRSSDNSNCHCDQFFVIVTKFLSRWQKIGHAAKNKKTERKALGIA